MKKKPPFLLALLLLITCLFALSNPTFSNAQLKEDAGTAAEPAKDCAAAVTLLEEQNMTLSREFRQLKREIAVLRQDLEKPGLQEIVGGIGYILGLFGVAAYIASRKNTARTPEP